MMRDFNYLKLTLISSILIGSLGWATSDLANPSTEEISYDVFVRELNSKVNRQSQAKIDFISGDPFEELQIHLSLGFVQNLDNLVVEDKSLSRMEDGVQLGVGIDLFSKEWVAEGLLKNFGRSTQDDTRISLREFDLRLSYMLQGQQSKQKIRLSNGLGARYMKFQDLKNENSQLYTTPIYHLGLGFLTNVGNHFDLEFEVQGHLALISETIDRQGLSFLLRINNVF